MPPRYFAKGTCLRGAVLGSPLRGRTPLGGISEPCEMMPFLVPPKKGGDSAESDLAHGVSAACLRESQSAIVLQSALVTFQRVGTHTYVRSRMRGADAGWLETKQKKLATGWRGRGRRFRAAARSRTSVSTPSPIGCATYTARGQRRTGQLQLPMAGDRNWRACVLAPSEEGGEEREEEKSEGKWAAVRHPRHALTM